jgi:hypothetical protein
MNPVSTFGFRPIGIAMTLQSVLIAVLISLLALVAIAKLLGVGQPESAQPGSPDPGMSSSWIITIGTTLLGLASIATILLRLMHGR